MVPSVAQKNAFPKRAIKKIISITIFFLPNFHLSLIDNNNPTNAIGVPIVTVKIDQYK